MARATTRIEGDRFPVSPIWLVIVDWPNEICPRCLRPLAEGSQAGYDEDVEACWCLACVHRWLDEDADDEQPRPKPMRRIAQLNLHLEDAT